MWFRIQSSDVDEGIRRLQIGQDSEDSNINHDTTHHLCMFIHRDTRWTLLQRPRGDTYLSEGL